MNNYEQKIFVHNQTKNISFEIKKNNYSYRKKKHIFFLKHGKNQNKKNERKAKKIVNKKHGHVNYTRY